MLWSQYPRERARVLIVEETELVPGLVGMVMDKRS